MKIKIISHSDVAVRDTTISKVYDATFHSRGSRDAWGEPCKYDSLCFKDDVGDKVSIWTHNPTYGVIEISSEEEEVLRCRISTLEKELKRYKDWYGSMDSMTK